MAKEVSKKTYKAAKGARNINISQTQWKTNVAGAKGKAGRLYGPKGQRFTGTVDLGGGKKAVYRQGKRVTPGKTKGGGVTSYQAPRTSNGSARTSTGGVVKEVKGNPKFTSAGPKFGGGSGVKINKPSVSQLNRIEGPKQSIPVTKVQSQAARAKQRQAMVKSTVAKSAALAHPGIRPFTAGYMLFTSPVGKQAMSTPGKVLKKATNWWSGK